VKLGKRKELGRAKTPTQCLFYIFLCKDDTTSGPNLDLGNVRAKDCFYIFFQTECPIRLNNIY
jgi:hypothetical protein